ncbi:MAG: polyprenyl synthetase family protein [Anaerolineaceae bacterium]|nr:MAG: polyprenyl synthetase family protein [Anaerolineaceae bacterium]
MREDESISLRVAMLEAIEEDLKRAIQPIQSDRFPELRKMIDYHMGWLNDGQSRGKRIRPLIALLCCAAAGGDWENILPAASAIELIHSFTLVHDDIEDHSDTRRGRATLWKLWGVPQAINTGDSLFIISRLTTHRLAEKGINPQLILEAQYTLDQACLQLTQGQHLDLSFETQDKVTVDDYFEMIEGKTSALITASSTIGAQLAGAPESIIEKYRTFGHHLGLAFQVQDDILGIWGDPEKTGKPASDDLRQRKKTLPTLYAVANSPSFADLFIQESDQVTVQDLYESINQVDALVHVQNFSHQQTELALQALGEAEPKEPAARELNNIANRLIRRES